MTLPDRCARLGVLLLAICQAAYAGSGITVLLSSPPVSLDERFANEADALNVAHLIAPGLFAFNDEGEPVPDLAESYREVDPRTVEVTLRPALTFHDGSQLTPRDVKATLDGLRAPELRAFKASKFEPIEHVEITSERTVRIHLKRPYAPLLAELTIGIVPEGRARPPGAEAQSRSPIGAGPFRLASWPDGDHIELVPFDGYYGGKPRISGLHFRVVRDDNTQALELLSGGADLASAVEPTMLPKLDGNPHLSARSKPGTAFAYLAFNLRSGPTADVRVRRALCMALDPTEIVERKFRGLAVPATGMLPTTHWAYAPTTGCRRDLEAASRLLDEAGFPKDARGKRPLSLSYKTSTNHFRQSIALILKSQMEALGIEVNVTSLEFNTLRRDQQHGNFQMFTMRWEAVIEPDLMRQVFSTQYIPGPENDFVGLNRVAYRNPELDDVLERASRAPRSERKALYAKALAVLDRDLPYAPLWHERSVYVVSDRLADFEPSAHGFLTPLARAREVPSR